ncbi:uncharacterized protein BP5553_01329 [Venustampulla echinocandica]|uniref:PIN protein n=1 Tax=Venustampulla echinocandica TaxID=2656787 RepID=A0A370U0P1_9HELO|nr:uncharacterized protein BP5553_01329 [Venustampulla echinocandica]RDL41350.1 hypothetical protein BP5553_01329 [Venustampulla echinocandica]
MGIKGIYGEIGPGERVALSKLAIEKFEQTSRPLRVAIDVSIWQFQIQAGQGGTNPAIRTLYYRLLRLLSVSVQPLFVFDGPHKPPFKRNKKTGQGGAMVPNMLTKQLLKLFGFPFHTAPGEAEAECALLQREGLVDAVLSEDVDTLMFGCGLTFRNWSSEGTKGNKSPTHVSVYDAKKTKAGKSGLDREGMVLVALMSGGDYITEGIPGCGIKVACEAARAGFGKSLCHLSKSDATALETWRKSLAREIQTNESKYFRVKHKALKIHDSFPNTEVLGYYTHPVVSSASKLQKLKEDISWDSQVDVQGLRLFVAEAFDWTHKTGARKFIRGLAPVLLVHKLRLKADRRDSGYGDLILTAMNEMELVREICGKRTHITSDGIPELRVIYHPLDIVGIDLDAEDSDSEDFGRDGLAPVNDDDQVDAYQSDNDRRSRSASPTKRAPSIYDPAQPDKLWMPETIVKIGVPLKAEDYEASLRDPKKILKAKAAAKRAVAQGGVSKGAMDRFVKVSKPGSGSTASDTSILSKKPHQDSDLPPVYLAPILKKLLPEQLPPSIAASKAIRTTRVTRGSVAQNVPSSTAATTRTRRKAATKEKPQSSTNPWTRSNPNSSSQASPAVTKSLNQPTKSSPPRSFKHSEYPIDIQSSPPARQPSPPANTSSPIARKHSHSITPFDSDSEIEASPESPKSRSKDSRIDTQSAAEDDRPRPSPRKKKRSPTSLHENNPPTPPDFQSGRPDSPSPSFSPTQSINLGSPNIKNANESEIRAARSSPSPSPELYHPVREKPSPISRGSRIPQPKGKSREIISLSSSPPVPSPSASLLNPHEDTEYQEHIESNETTSTTGEEPEPLKKPKGKKYLMLRESLPGAWKSVGEEEMERKPRGQGRAWRMSQVEILDLCND